MKISDILEARIPGPEVTYTEKEVKGKVDRVIAELKGHKSGAFTKLAFRYKIIDMILKRLNDKREILNIEAKERVSELFDVQDEIHTRVVNTISLTLTVAKATKKTPSPKFDREGFMTELHEMLPELIDQLKVLEAKYTTLGKTIAVSPALRVKLPDRLPFESVNEDVDKLAEWAKKWANRIRENLANSFDKKLMMLKRRINAAN